MRKYLLLFSVLLFSISCKHGKPSSSLQLFCAASLTEVMTAMADTFSSKTQIPVILNFASSGTLARQIAMGAPASLYISANKKWMTYVMNMPEADSSTKEVIAGNSLVLIASDKVADGKGDMNLAVTKRFAMGDPEMVPAGTYAMQAIKNLGLWPVQGKLLTGKDVKSTLKLVEIGEADYGIVYKTDALNSHRVRIVGEIPDSLYSPVKYYICSMKSKRDAEAKLFLSFLKSKEAQRIWHSYGFKTTP